MTMALDEDIIVCAFRYALGRSTYMVCRVTDYLIEVWPMLSNKLQDHIVEKIVEALNDGEAGDEVDENLWRDVLSNCDEEHLRRINDDCRENHHTYTRLDI